MTKILFSVLILTAPAAFADNKPMCAPTGWSCRQDPCCSITDYCNVSGTCTPNRPVSKINSLQEFSHKFFSLLGQPNGQSAPISSVAQF